eukprot:2700598-Rhodomonas_salina.1
MRASNLASQAESSVTRNFAVLLLSVLSDCDLSGAFLARTLLETHQIGRNPRVYLISTRVPAPGTPGVNTGYPGTRVPLGGPCRFPVQIRSKKFPPALLVLG